VRNWDYRCGSPCLASLEGLKEMMAVTQPKIFKKSFGYFLERRL
jgi:hypothetical protein